MAKRSAARGGTPPAAIDLATRAQAHADLRALFVKHAFTRLPLIGVLVITVNMYVQVRGDVGLAVAVAQNLTFGGLLVVVLLNLALYIMLGIMVAAMPLVFDRDYNPWTRVVGTALVLLFAAVMFYTVSWVLLAALAVVFIVIGVIVRRLRRTPPMPVTSATVRDELTPDAPPADTELRTLWAEGRAMLRLTDPPGPPITPTEAALTPAPEPTPFAELAEGWNARATAIRQPAAKTVTRLAFAGIVGFVALFGVNILTQPIRFAPLELVSIQDAQPRVGFVLLQGSNGVFIPDKDGVAQFITASDVTYRALCQEPQGWWEMSPMDFLTPHPESGVSCRP